MQKGLKYIIVVLFFVSSLSATKAQSDNDAYLDSLMQLLPTMPADTNKIATLNTIAYQHYCVDTVAKYAQQQLELAQKLKHPYYEAKALGYLYWCNFHYNDLVKANDYAFKAIVIGETIGNKRIVASNYLNLGITYAMMQDATQADNYYHKALDIFTQIADSAQMCEVLRNIAYNNNLYELYDASEECYLRALSIDQCLNNTESVSEDLLGLGDLYFNKCANQLEPDISLLQKAKQYYTKALDAAQQTDYEYSYFIVYAELPMVLLSELDKNEYHGARRTQILDSCKTLLNKGYNMAQKFGYEIDKIDIDFGYASYLIKIHEYTNAKLMLDSLDALFNSSPDTYKHQRAKYYNALTLYSREQGDYKQAYQNQVKYEYYHRQNRRKDYEITARLNMAQAQFDSQLNLQHQREQTLKSEADKSAIISVAALIVLLLVSALTIVIARSYIRSKRNNDLLDAKNIELEQQKEETIAQNECLAKQNKQIEHQNKIITQVNNEITDSINYASIIQRATLPSEQQLNKIFAEHMVIYKPLNIVSGDFYWATQTEHYKMIAVADCTGHGVPGAFLSMLGMSILDYVALAEEKNANNISAGQMLDHVRELFKQSLHQSDNTNHDGIDMSLLVINTINLEAHYAGAFRPIIVAHSSNLTCYHPDRMPIGTHYNEAEHFNDNIIQLSPSDTIYLYSDGITDQFGYPKNDHTEKKFTARRLIQLLNNIKTLPLHVQKTQIYEAFEQWTTTSDGTQRCEQTDDAVLIGIRI